ncbi:MAG: CinA family protein [Pseudomonadota bacterium]
MFSEAVLELARNALARCREDGIMLATAESCTGGLIVGALTEVPGSSDVVDRGFVTYSNEAKSEMLGVDPALIMSFGAVSAPVAKAMAEGALERSNAWVAVAVTGIAGPGGGSAEKPEGLVHFAVARRGDTTLHLENRFGPLGRREVRLATVEQALKLIV